MSVSGWLGRLRCRFNHHRMRSRIWPLGFAQHPAGVEVCVRCGLVRNWAGAWDCAACIGEWPSFTAFKAAHRQQVCDTPHHELKTNYCPDCGERIKKS